MPYLQQHIFDHTYENGLVLVAQSMPWLQSAAFSIRVPAGCRYDPDGQIGLSNFTCEMVQRGCGDLDSRQFVEQLELNGIDHSSSSSVYHMHFGGAMCADRLSNALQIYADLLRHPQLPEAQLEDGRLVCYQEIRAVDDDLPQRAMMRLRERFYGQPDGRDCHGSVQSVQSITNPDIQRFFEQGFRPDGTIISVAGKLDWPELKDHVGSLLADWQPGGPRHVNAGNGEHGSLHIPFESQQTQIALAFESVPYSHPDYFRARGAVGVLSDGMSSRLFQEIREKRGLCYSVFAANHSLKDRGCVICYSGTTSERAQQTLEVLIDQLLNLKQGIREDELRRLKVQIRSGLVMQQESCRSRASAMAGDWFHLGRIRSLDELNQEINQLSVESINRYLGEHPPRDFVVVTLGPQSLSLPENAVSPTPA